MFLVAPVCQNKVMIRVGDRHSGTENSQKVHCTKMQNILNTSDASCSSFGKHHPLFSSGNHNCLFQSVLWPELAGRNFHSAYRVNKFSFCFFKS
jgi:hypothetical protein